jgi:hypothetical protein
MHKNNIILIKTFSLYEFAYMNFTGKGQNYEFHNVEIQKERQKKFKASERQNCLFSFSLLRNQNVENGFLVDQNVKNE